MARQPKSGEKRQASDTDRRFAEAYLAIQCKSAAEAARRCGLSDEYGNELLKKESVRKIIAQLREEQRDRLMIEADQVLMESWNVASSDISEIVDLKYFEFLKHEIPDFAWKAVQGIKVKRERRETQHGVNEKIELEIRLHDKNQATRLVAQTIGMIGPKADDDDKLDLAEAYRIEMEKLEQEESSKR